MLQFDVEAGTWKQIGKLQETRSYLAIAEVNLAALGCVGNLNSVKKENKITNIIITKELGVQIYLNLQLVLILS